jgi:carnitine 3-dehydrogenase
MSDNQSIAIIGGGVIGGGWAARFALNGWAVKIFDPSEDARRTLMATLDNARRSLPRLTDAALPAEQKIEFCDSVEQAVKNTSWVQESVPERLDIKHSVYRDIQAHAPADAVLGSSTSGFKPTELQQSASRPEQILVTHPFNPVYLLPLVEVVAGEQTSSTIVDRACSVLTDLGMKPLKVRKEIDAHIADRFLEAVWREGLWMIKDGIATTEEIDDAIRYGFGLRWGQMGLFETYRVAGGEAGMAHFIAQFGPCLQWPWTKLMDVPELTDDLVRQIADQSDEQSGQYSIRELERIRDDNLVSMMRGLKGNNWGAGELLNQHEQRLKKQS